VPDNTFSSPGKLKCKINAKWATMTRSKVGASWKRKRENIYFRDGEGGRDGFHTDTKTPDTYLPEEGLEPLENLVDDGQHCAGVWLTAGNLSLGIGADRRAERTLFGLG
jgi:hypothetical protein